jgi:hypothetical protein
MKTGEKRLRDRRKIFSRFLFSLCTKSFLCFQKKEKYAKILVKTSPKLAICRKNEEK